MNLPEITMNIGTHQIKLRPIVNDGKVGESLEIITTWHKHAVIHSWTLAKLQEWADVAENDVNYEHAEWVFIAEATGTLPVAITY